MKQLVDLEARGRVRRASMLPLSVVCAALTEFGRCDATSAILTAVHKMPRRWHLEAQAEEDRARREEDLCLTAELEALDEACDEMADVDLAFEMLTAPLPYDAAPEDASKTSNMALAPVPAAVEQQLAQYAAYRQQPFNRHRSTGAAAVEDTTVESDRANALRWLGYLKAEHGQPPSLKLFGHERVGEWTEAWILKLRGLGLKGSTIAVYVNGVLSVSAFACAALVGEEGELCPTHELLTLRKQAEAISKQERLFEAKHPAWLSWEDAQKARQACVAKLNAATERRAKQALLKDALVLAFHTLQPPDRVGGASRPPRAAHAPRRSPRAAHAAHARRPAVVRRLRLGHPNGSLYKAPGEASYTVDLSRMKHKTSRFYGPQISTLPAAIQPFVEAYEQSIVFEMTGDNPYLFSQASSWQWRQVNTWLQHGNTRAEPRR